MNETPIRPLDLSIDQTRRPRRWLPFFVLLVIVSVSGFAYLARRTSVPDDFAGGTLVTVPDGATLSDIASILVEKNVIRSRIIFTVLVSHGGKENAILSGTYLFERPENVLEIARRFERGERGIETRRVTLPEGLTRKEMAKVLDEQLSGFDPDAFFQETASEEGYLFPDTYFFLTTATSGEIRAALRENFEKKTASLHASSSLAKKDWGKIMTMASIIEGEAMNPVDRRIVSGILWKRIDKGMRLGVDAPFLYIMGKGSLELTEKDLATTSPYNTYRNSGLPPTPINNPGYDSIAAALEPSSTPYLYYLSDEEGKMHYARTFEEHKLNKARYIR
jgi:UPF0755 protein